MLTQREARQRAEVHNARIVYNRDYNEYRVTLNEWRGADAENKAYYTDCIEDAVITAGAMRKRENDCRN